ncbi:MULTISPECIES: beta-ketoacyl synthase [unclassified Modicisalibacter]|uniref:beta-ketoacyl synthase n=1 Tax=unclassified Modicisalibacter TaxID=2679913 RepID=UPI001CCD4E07|nr:MULTISPECIES: beta-ketoacyl synthase [unclassified Modicisalibacter]MBZ9559201.1 beta-ketoacyl synthase [Modicisalibacter sp. R2A 31.J]MBZ9576634.1 beta-ketoacyl synthase [Modicisalibacter sp. MOD 31.J]
MGGVNAAGRTSGHQAFRRTVLDALPAEEQQRTVVGLAAMMQLVTRQADGHWQDIHGNRLDDAEIAARFRQQVIDHTLIRRIEDEAFNADGIPANRQAQLRLDAPLVFKVRRRQLPDPLPETWQVRDLDGRQVEVSVPAGVLDVLLPERRQALVRAAGQLPSGFAPDRLYRSVHHPRGLSMAVFGASDCLGQSGLDWESLRDGLDPDQIAVYAGNSIGQLDDPGWGGLLKSFVSGNRATSKQMPLGYGQMPADFINAYVLGSVGATGAMLGACASFLYNLRLGIEDIRSGTRRVVMVGTSDAPITPEVVEGFRSMGALADDDSLKALDALSLLTDADYQRACRPFARNCGFTIAEASQFVLLMDDTLALETGAQILASVPGVFVNADGWKRSISAPGIGNYITLGKAATLAREILGERGLRERTFIHAHATSTPKNRVTESHVLDAVARAHDITDWPVAAVKAFVGHSQGSAAGDQLVSALGSFAHGLVPGIPTLDAVADDVHGERLRLFREPLAFEADAAFINAKGFGGNNATGLLLSPAATERLLVKRHGQAAVDAWRERAADVRARGEAYLARADAADFAVIYRFGEGVLEGPELGVDADGIRIPGYARPVSLAVDNPFGRLDD